MYILENEIKEEINKEREVLERCRKSRFALKQYNGMVLLRCDDPKHKFTRYYYRNALDKSSKRVYCKQNQVAKIRGIKQLKFVEETIDRTENNISVLEELSKQLKSLNPDDINATLPKAYQGAEGVRKLFHINPNADEWLRQRTAEKEEYIKRNGEYKPEQLKHKTIDGTPCRSMGEVNIYNFLYQSGYTFIYEPAMIINNRRCRPDFLILCNDGTEIIIEHLGMTERHQYLARQDEKIEDYIKDNWVPNVNLFLTFNDYYGHINMEAIAWLIKARVEKK